MSAERDETAAFDGRLYDDSKNPHEAADFERSGSASPLLSLPFARRRLSTRSSLLKTIIYVVLALTVGLAVGSWSSPRLPEWAQKYLATHSTPQFKDWSSHRLHQNPGLNETEAPNAACLSVPNDVLAPLRSATEPQVTFVSEDGTVIPDGGEVAAPAAVCILYTLPQTHVKDELYSDVPIPGKGPDSIHMYLNGTDVILTYPPLRPLPDQPQAQRQISDEAVIYYAEATLYNAGIYETVAENEFTNWRWAQEWEIESGRPIFHYRGGWNLEIDVIENYVFEPRTLPSASINVTGPKHLPLRPTCDNLATAANGRWYKYSKFPIMDRELVDEWGYAWQGDACYLDYFTATEVLDCFADKTIHFYGDSMTRRLAKSVMSGGKWCLDVDAKCQDEDDREWVPVPKLDIDEDGEIYANEIRRGPHFQYNDYTAIEFGKNSSLYFSFLSSVTNSTMNWMDPLFAKSDLVYPLKTADANREIKPGALSRAPPQMAAADLVVLGLGAWDQAFTNRFDDFEERLVQFRDAFMNAYPEAPIVMRMSNSWCCRGTAQGFRRYTGGRIQEFDDRVRKVFEVQGAKALDGRILVVDPTNMNGRPDVIFDYGPSDANHPRASHVRTEMQMMVNSICQRNAKTGKVSMRKQY